MGGRRPSPALGLEVRRRDWRSSSVSQCLTHQAIPLLEGTYTDEIGRELFSATAELARVVAWSAFDSGQHAVAQQHGQATLLAVVDGHLTGPRPAALATANEQRTT
ncbi:hypothetical protein ACGFZP_31480 [Kitasatospora sp. NPDC048239]|uniref:hypothetical protein n=1 Tax=Kitasatospora sp. NPDC048239 TaxID=3364046 RepID=UPI0037193697